MTESLIEVDIYLYIYCFNTDTFLKKIYVLQKSIFSINNSYVSLWTYMYNYSSGSQTMTRLPQMYMGSL